MNQYELVKSKRTGNNGVGFYIGNNIYQVISLDGKEVKFFQKNEYIKIFQYVKNVKKLPLPDWMRDEPEEQILPI